MRVVYIGNHILIPLHVILEYGRGPPYVSKAQRPCIRDSIHFHSQQPPINETDRSD